MPKKINVKNELVGLTITAIATGVIPQNAAIAYELTEMVYKTSDENTMLERHLIRAQYNEMVCLIHNSDTKKELTNCMTMIHYAKMMESKGWIRKANDAFKTARALFDDVTK